jgi:hypothetical protein
VGQLNAPRRTGFGYRIGIGQGICRILAVTFFIFNVSV